jgi:heme/copper-type cytochrome/quinol oxidase subunit 2
MLPEEDLEEGGLRMLEVDNRVILPELTHVRFVVTSADVIHSYACPSLAIKCDAYPGRLNQVSVLINREGVFYGQCSEICGILHSSMPIVIESVCLEKFLSWLDAQSLSLSLIPSLRIRSQASPLVSRKGVLKTNLYTIKQKISYSNKSPVKVYPNAATYKKQIMQDNKGKSGIYL